MKFRKKRSALEDLLPRGSWFDSHPEVGGRQDLEDLVIEVDQLEAVLTGILGLNGRQLESSKRNAVAQFESVKRELELAEEDSSLDELRSWIDRLWIAYEQFMKDARDE